MTPRRYKRAEQKFLAPEVLDSVSRAMVALVGARGIKSAVAGGYAMQIYGSDRLTGDVDLVSEGLPSPADPLKNIKPLTFGGCRYETKDGVEVDFIVRGDQFQALYEDALFNAGITEDKLPIITPEYLAAMKMAAGRPKDEGDLLWLLKQDGLLDRPKTLEIVGRLVGGQFAQEAMQSFIDQADWELEREKKAE